MNTNDEMSQVLNSNDASRYLWQSWRLLGLHPTKKYRKVYWCYAVFIFLAAVWHPFHLLLQVFYIDDYVRVINNLSISLTLLSATVKYVIMFYFTTSNLYEAGKYFDKLDGFAKDNTSERDMINTEIRLCHRLYYGYIVAYTMPLVGFAILGYYQRSLLFEGWFPFDWTASDATYYVAYGLQVFGTSITLMQNLTTDTSQLLYLLIALVHLRVIKRRLSNMGNIMSKNSTEQYEELVMCVHVFQEWMR
ncbi:odorant receptor 33a-like [Teleopsis dalmanni]|uniref:odorant receptor 33a-like n=1 Tax=Teleopsis dalmanni TaxID=139649 RepID=UPI0018CDA134|nr:odorant receptor 33a-like [Teleopsis dalmanni]